MVRRTNLLMTGPCTVGAKGQTIRTPHSRIFVFALLEYSFREIHSGIRSVNRHSTVTHYQRPTVTQLQEGGTGGEVSEILFFSAKSKRRPSLIYSMQIIPVCLSIVARRKGVSATRRGGLNWTPISLLVGHPCKLFHTSIGYFCSVRSSLGIPYGPRKWRVEKGYSIFA